MRTILFLICVVVCSSAVLSQQNNIWYFGNKAGVNFTPTPGQSSPSILQNSSMITIEGSSSICDSSGNLLFYSNGRTIYNRNHQVMKNGDNLMGDFSTIQSCIIIPQPGSDSLYYIFTADAVENNFANGYRFSVIDMEKENADGEVISKNNLLSASSTERLTAARHANGTDVWIIGNDRNSNIFRAWLLNCNGLQLPAVVSSAGQVMDQYLFTNVGQMKVSPDGTKLCQTHFPFVDDITDPDNFLQLFDFNNATGTVSNPQKITSPGGRYLFADFSPDSRLLYATRPFENLIEQFQITLPTANDISLSGITMPVQSGFAGMQLAPDGKIYLGAGDHLDVIYKPDIAGIGCDYRPKWLALNNSAGLGLPSFINDASFDPYNDFTYQILDSCTGLLQFTGLTSLTGLVNWYWDFGDGNISTNQNPVHQFTPSNQLYVVKLKISSAATCSRSFQKSKNVIPGGVISNVDFSIINRCDSGYFRFVNKTPFADDLAGQFYWDFGDGNFSTATHPFHTYAASGVYLVKLKMNTTTVCLDDSVAYPINFQQFNIKASPDQVSILPSQTIQLKLEASNLRSVAWSPGIGLDRTDIVNPVAVPLQDIVYYVTATDVNGCKDTDSVIVKVLPLDEFYVPTAFTPNNDGLNDNIKPIFGADYTLGEFSIFNRLGEKIFTTNKRGEGWNGQVQGIPQTTAVYVWMLKAYRNGQVFQKKGSFLLIR
jgi:gliding motility-associated-like protein